MNPIKTSFQRFRTLKTHKIYNLPIVIMMPHSACNCRCIMCDIWQDNKNLKQITEADLTGILSTLRKYNTEIVVMSGGEALLNKHFFKLCEILKGEGIKITLLSTGLTLQQNASDIVKYIDEVIVSLDGPEQIHNAIRRIPNAFQKLQEGVKYLKSIKPNLRITARSVIQNENFRRWSELLQAAKKMGLDQISFLAADISSTAFNRESEWEEERKMQIQPSQADLPEFKLILENLIKEHAEDFRTYFIAESPEKLKKIYLQYAAHYALNTYPNKKCNAPWVSTVIEADGKVRHCFFLESMGNIHQKPLDKLLNSEQAIAFRKNLDTQKNPNCVKCVCSLNLPLTTHF